jgi:type 1 glutamine amidotransferase
MTDKPAARAHLITGGFPRGAAAGHDHDHVRLRLLTLLAEQSIQASVANDFQDVEAWLPLSRLLITYTAGPYPDEIRSKAIETWLRAGGHWLALHGTSGGRAERVEGIRQRRTVRTDHHRVLGSMFLTHPPLCRFRVDVADTAHPLTHGIEAFDVEDEPYFIQLDEPDACRILLTANYGEAAVSDSVTRLYGRDASLLSDGRTRVLGYTRAVGVGAVTYFALGHCHDPASRPGHANDGMPLMFRGPWENPAFLGLLRNAIRWNGEA